MDKIRVPKVEKVTLWRRGNKFDGTLHFSQHHIIFSYLPPQEHNQNTPATTKPRELWITYPMIAFCTYRPAPPVSRLHPSVRLRCRDFTFVAFHFQEEKPATDAFETIRNLSCRLGRIEDLYAFSYKAQGPEKQVDGWAVYNVMEEFRRQGVGSKAKSRGWRITQINSDYQYSPTYPAVLAVPTAISDNVLNYAGKYRSRVRIPVLTYLHPINDCSISRSSQPLVGVRQNRSVQDEKLVAAIFATSKTALENQDSFGSDSTEEASSRSSTVNPPPAMPTGSSNQSLESMENDVINRLGRNTPPEASEEDGTKVYGATQHNLIIDARPTINAFAMQAVGMGSENMDHYPFATKTYLNIDNIHVMRDSLEKVVDAIKDGDVTPLSPNREILAKSNWLKHIANMLSGVNIIARQVGIEHSHVLIHCSDGWDRTSQLSALSQLCLDPYYRTMEGFIVLVEKDFVSFGHMFRHRSGYMGSEKWFDIENERIGGSRPSGDSPSRSTGSGNAFGNALAGAKGFFNKRMNPDRNNGNDPEDDVLHPVDGSPHRDRTSPPATRKVSGAAGAEEDPKPVTKPKETSPIFHQFLDAVYQLHYQHPTRFEFNERFLRRLLYHLYSCQYGTFLFDSEKARVDAHLSERTRSVWDYFLARKEQFLNTKYDPVVDDNVRGRERLLFPDNTAVRWWAELFGRTDDEMNRPIYFQGPPPGAPEKPQTAEEAVEASALRGVESAAVPEDPVERADAATPTPAEPPRESSSSTFPAERLGSAFPSERIGGVASGLSSGLSGMDLGSHVDQHPDERSKAARRAVDVEL